MSLDEIPKDQRTDFPIGVSEVIYDTPGELAAFIHGLGYAQDIDVEYGDPFSRDGKEVVRVKVGDFDEE